MISAYNSLIDSSNGLLKIDCEGNELKVINGIQNEDWDIIKQLIIEVHDIGNRLDYIQNLLKDKNYSVREAANYDQAVFEIEKKLPDIAIIDVKLDKGDKDGIELLKKIKKLTELVPVIMISGHANVEMAVESLKLGAYEFITKPFAHEQLLNFIRRGLENVSLKKENVQLENRSFHSFELIGESSQIIKIKKGSLHLILPV